MPKDFKIGMTLGLALVTIATLWLATHPSLSLRARILRSNVAGSQPESAQQYPALAIENNPDVPGRSSQHADDNHSSSINNQMEPLGLTAYEQAEKIQTQRFHIVGRGETLSGISAKYYGSANKWQKILDANRSRLKDANKLKPGTKLIIPE